MAAPEQSVDAHRRIDRSQQMELSTVTASRVESLLRNFGVDWENPEFEGRLAALPLPDGRMLDLQIQTSGNEPVVSVAFLHQGYRSPTDEHWFRYEPRTQRLLTADMKHEQGGLRHINHMLDIADHTIRTQRLDPFDVKVYALGLLYDLSNHFSTKIDTDDPEFEVRSLTALMPGYQTRNVTARFHSPTGRLQELEISPEKIDKPRKLDDIPDSTRFIARFITRGPGDLIVELETAVPDDSADIGFRISTVILDPKNEPDLRALHRTYQVFGLLRSSIDMSKEQAAWRAQQTSAA